MIAAWREMTPAEVLAAYVVLTAEQTAYVLALSFAKGRRVGEPDPGQVLDLVARGLLWPVDSTQPTSRWRFSAHTVRNYLEHDGLELDRSHAAVRALSMAEAV